VLLAAGSDGRDGPTDAAGAVVWAGMPTSGRDAALEDNDAYPWLDRHGALIRTGATGTNVADLVIGLRR
jgi:hydroxypyruvate reductase